MARKNRSIQKSDAPTLDIARFVKKDFLEETAKPKVGDLYYYKSYDIFYLIEKVDEKKDGHGNTRLEGKCLESRDGVNWRKSKERDIDGFIEHDRYYIKLHMNADETPEQVIADLRKQLYEQFEKADQEIVNDKDYEEDTVDEDGEDEEDVEESTETGLIIQGGKELYEQTAFSILRTESRIRAITLMVEARVSKIREQAYALQAKLKKVMRVLGMLETYLGTHEEIFQITQGAPADQFEPISIRQRFLYMDEESLIVDVFDSRDGVKLDRKLNFQNVELFDEWLCKDGNLDVILPEKKGIVALRPSRNREQYADEDFWTRAEKEAADRMVYLLIRNGDNLYRIWTSLSMGDTFFPTEQASAEIAEMIEKAWSNYDKEKVEEAQSEYLENTLLVQGLIDRTECFHPIPPGRLEMTNPKNYEPGGLINLVRDAEPSLGDGHISYDDWLKEINGRTQRGTRIFFTGVPWEKNPDRGHRFDMDRRWYPDYPARGIYTIEEVGESMRYSSSPTYKFLYMPNDPVYRRGDDWQDTERRRRVMFNIRRDEFINYDEFDVESIEYFLKSREQREVALLQMPTLIMLREKRIKELEQEKAFAKLVAERENTTLEHVMMLVEWWKKKVINKRPLSEDDAKAWRMITKRIRREKRMEVERG